MTKQQPVLAVDDLQVSFGRGAGALAVVDGVSLRVERGEAVGIVGESGSGKSLTALSLLRLVPRPGEISRGDIRLDGVSLPGLDDAGIREVRRSRIGMIFQDAGSYLNPVMTVEAQIAEALGLHGRAVRKVRDRVVAALANVRIPEPERVARAYPHELSGGMQQRVMIASVLIRQPELIIADEPTTALDATVQFQILEFLGALRQQSEAALVLISHDLAVVTEVCDRVYVMYAGQIVEEGRADTIFEKPQHPYTMALAAAMLDPFDHEAEVKALPGAPPDMGALPAGCRFHPRCAFAFDRCRRAPEPPMFVLGEAGAARCWLREPNAMGQS